ncbi:MAG: allophanate hydrolase, partial [Streptomycetaceae bacterium]|nr:allophanate hydrolase [Streptomycetaceae bacterium]
QLLSFGARLHRRTRTAAGYRLFRLPGPGIPRPGLVAGGDGPAAGIAVEVWDVPEQGVGWLLSQIPAPLGLGRVALADGTSVAGFVTVEGAVRDAEDVSRYESWRRVLAAADGSPG